MKSKIFHFILVRTPKNTTIKEHILRSSENSLVTFILAKDEQEARMKAARLIPTHINHTETDLDEIEIVLRPY